MVRWALAAVVAGAVLSGCGSAQHTAGTDSSGDPTAPLTSGIRGRAVATPGCPVQQVDHPCPPVAVVAHIEISTGASAGIHLQPNTAAAE